MLKAVVLQNFATIGTSDITKHLGKNYWTTVAISQHLIDEERLNGLHRLNTRPLDLVIQSGSRFALFNLQAFKLFESSLATNTIQQCLAHYLTPHGNILIGIQPSGDVIIITEGLQQLKRVKKPAFINIQQKSQQRWFQGIPIVRNVVGLLTTSKPSSSQVSPAEGHRSSPAFSTWWPATSTTTTSINMPDHLKSHFPYLTALPDGLAILCAFSPANCYIFLSSYETALREKSIANFHGSKVPGHWYRIIMHKSFIAKWLEDKGVTPWFEARLCYNTDDNGNSTVGGTMLYAVFEGIHLEIVFGTITWHNERFTLSWETAQYELDWALREPGVPYNLGSRFVARLSADCKKIAIVISNHLGLYLYIQNVPANADQESTVHISRQTVALCVHSDYDGAHFYKKECWVSDVQWLVEDAYIACMSLCGSLSIFYATGEPMILKVRKPGALPDENKLARYFFPIFYLQQLQDQLPERASTIEGFLSSGGNNQSEESREILYPTVKWIDDERILACSSGTKIELFSIQRVLNLPLEEGELVLKSSDWDLRPEGITVSSVRLQAQRSKSPTPAESRSQNNVDSNNIVASLR